MTRSTFEDTAELAARANALAARCRYGGAPLLAADSSADAVARWLQWNDRNGAYHGVMREAESLPPMESDEAWDELARVFADDDNH